MWPGLRRSWWAWEVPQSWQEVPGEGWGSGGSSLLLEPVHPGRRWLDEAIFYRDFTAGWALLGCGSSLGLGGRGWPAYLPSSSLTLTGVQGGC